MNGSSGYLLDTNIILSLMRSNSLGQYIDATYGVRVSFNRSVISVVTVGEMLSLARKFAWGDKKIAALKGILNQLVWIDINQPEILEAYGVLDSESIKLGRTMGKNDIWIAASARVSGMTILTTDTDFDHLHGIWISRIWIDPNRGKTL